MNLPHNDEHYTALGKYTYLRQRLTEQHQKLQERVGKFGEDLKEAVTGARLDTYPELETETWKERFAGLCKAADELSGLVRETDGYARKCDLDGLKLQSRPAPRDDGR